MSSRSVSPAECHQGQWTILWVLLQLLTLVWVWLLEKFVGWQRQIEAYQSSSQTCVKLSFVYFYLENGPEA